MPRPSSGQRRPRSKSHRMSKLLLVLATVLLCSCFNSGQVMPNTEIGRVTVQVPLLSNGKPVMTRDKDQVEVAHVVEVKAGKVIPEELVVPLVKVRSMRAIVEAKDHGITITGIPNPEMPYPGILNPGTPKPGMSNPGIENHSMPNAGIPNLGMPNPGIPNPGMPNTEIENHSMPNAGIPNLGIPNPGIPNPGLPNQSIPNPGIPGRPSATSDGQILVIPLRSTRSSPIRLSPKNCHQLLLGIKTTNSPTPMPIPPAPVEQCDQLCTKLELNPICSYNGICVHEFPNQCVMDTFNCKHRDLSFRAVEEEVCQRLCARRCRAEDLKM